MVCVRDSHGSSKVCSHCHAEKPLEEFYPDRTKKAGYKYQCKQCARKDRQENRRKNGMRKRPLQRDEPCLKCGEHDPRAQELSGLCKPCFEDWVEFLKFKLEKRAVLWERFLHG